MRNPAAAPARTHDPAAPAHAHPRCARAHAHTRCARARIPPLRPRARTYPLRPRTHTRSAAGARAIPDASGLPARPPPRPSVGAVRPLAVPTCRRAAVARVLRLALKGLTIELLAIGRAHGIAITSHKAVWAWGCGAHGQVGPGESDIDEPAVFKLPSMQVTPRTELSGEERDVPASTRTLRVQSAIDAQATLKPSRDQVRLRPQLRVRTPLTVASCLFSMAGARRGGGGRPQSARVQEGPAGDARAPRAACHAPHTAHRAPRAAQHAPSMARLPPCSW
eukprot:2031166-Prymnesium_polylepis.1